MLELLKSIWPLILLVAFMAAVATVLRLLGIDLRSPSKRSRRRPPNMIDPVVDALLPEDPAKPIEFPYKRIDTLLSRGELAFHRSLLIAVGTRYAIMAKVRVADLLRIEDAKNFQSALNRITSKHIDFVLCDMHTTRILAAIELDDASHEKQNRRDRDTFLEQAFAHANLPFLHFTAAASYNPTDIARQIDSRLTPASQSPPTPNNPKAR